MPKYGGHSLVVACGNYTLVSVTRKYLIFACAHGSIYVIEWGGPQWLFWDIPRVTLNTHVLAWAIVKYWETLTPISTTIALPVPLTAPYMLTLKSTLWYISVLLLLYQYEYRVGSLIFFVETLYKAQLLYAIFYIHWTLFCQHTCVVFWFGFFFSPIKYNNIHYKIILYKYIWFFCFELVTN